MKVAHIPFQETGFFSKTIVDYLEKKKIVTAFLQQFS